MFGNLRRPRCGGEARRVLYKAQLCAGCHAMREFSGRTTSLLANYDQSLLALVVSGVAGGAPVSAPCTAVPWRTVQVQSLAPGLRTLLAAGNLALVDAKLRDDLDDGPRWWTRALRWLLRGKVRRAHRALTELGFDVALVAQLPARQRAVEAAVATAAAPTLASLAAPSAEVLGEIFALAGRLADREPRVAALRRFGRAVGAAVYAFDALDDHDDDRRRGRFNAVAALEPRLGHAAAVAVAQQAVELAVVDALRATGELFDVGGDGPERAAIVRQVLQFLSQRAAQAADRLLDRPVSAAVRPGEAGDCDCPCDGCDCDCGDCSGCGPCDPCCDVCCLSDRKKKRQQAPQDVNELRGDR
ncbi:MAG: DUF5685 family protein [Planctomycetota bacterium]